jgi:hypothetical protein
MTSYLPSPLIQRGKVWYLRYTGADGRRTMKRLSTDKRVAEQLARLILDEQDRIRAGWIDAKDLAYREHEARPPVEHLADWHSYLTAKGSTVKHADLATYRARRVIKMSRVDRFRPDAESRPMGSQGDPGRAPARAERTGSPSDGQALAGNGQSLPRGDLSVFPLALEGWPDRHRCSRRRDWLQRQGRSAPRPANPGSG